MLKNQKLETNLFRAWSKLMYSSNEKIKEIINIFKKNNDPLLTDLTHQLSSLPDKYLESMRKDINNELVISSLTTRCNISPVILYYVKHNFKHTKEINVNELNSLACGEIRIPFISKEQYHYELNNVINEFKLKNISTVEKKIIEEYCKFVITKKYKPNVNTPEKLREYYNRNKLLLFFIDRKMNRINFSKDVFGFDISLRQCFDSDKFDDVYRYINDNDMWSKIFDNKWFI